ncbi:hypothetical protein HK102_007763 [Quaeritorhiza haematococci]|nr:hypothetical protein HK102_007763 [Quaeritorhiza haematococci]
MDALYLVQTNLPLLYILIATVTFTTFTRVFHISLGSVFALLVTVLVITWIHRSQTLGVAQFHASLDQKLKAIGNPDHFHHEPDFILIFYAIWSWKRINPDAFRKALQATNNVLKLARDIETGVNRCADNYGIAFRLSRKALNYVHSYVYSINHPLLIAKLKTILVRLNKTFESVLTRLQETCRNTENNVNAHTSFVGFADGPRKHDPMSDSPFDYY